ncbi:MAG: hypothetical protein K2H28_05045 [Ruminococcus sp.]|nr:hypothetical protein [Ruminococcus sp.]
MVFCHLFMKNKLLLMLLIAFLTVTGCTESQSFEVTDTENIATDIQLTSSDTTDAINDGDIIIKCSDGKETVLHEEDRQLYEQFYPLISKYSQMNYPGPIFINMACVYYKNFENYYNIIYSGNSTFQETSLSNYTNDVTGVRKYDPFCEAFYRSRSTMKTNPVQTAEMLDEQYGDTNHSETEFLTFKYNCIPVETNIDFSDPKKAISEIVEKYFEIPADKVIVGYSPEESLYYTYVIDADGKENSFLICTLFFDVENNNLKRTGIETYVRTHSEINTRFVSSAGNACITECLDTPYNQSQLQLKAYIIPENTIVTEHRNLCDIAGSIMTKNGNFSQEHNVKFNFLDDSDAGHQHFFAVHYVSWFTKN